MIGVIAHAVDEIERIQASSYFVTPGWLKVDPAFNPLRGNPRFERMLQAPTV